MKTGLIITDDFYGDPDSVRSFALQQEFSVQGNFPGHRTKTFLTDDVKEAIQTIVWNAGGEITNWNQEDGLSGSFEMATASDRSWIHTDHNNTWAGVCYLTPDAPVSGGTGLFMYKANKARYDYQLPQYESQDITKWELVDRVGNIYNRLVIYRSNMFHTSLDYFGSNMHDARLFQLFFFDTQY